MGVKQTKSGAKQTLPLEGRLSGPHKRGPVRLHLGDLARRTAIAPVDQHVLALDLGKNQGLAQPIHPNVLRKLAKLIAIHHRENIERRKK